MSNWPIRLRLKKESTLYTVTNIKQILMFLLMLCIGFAPLQSINAGNPGHMETMSTHCANCDVESDVDPDSCDGTQCMMSVGSCGANHNQSITQGIPFSSRVLIAIGGYLSNRASAYQSHLNFPIYRPPIAWIASNRALSAFCHFKFRKLDENRNQIRIWHIAFNTVSRCPASGRRENWNPLPPGPGPVAVWKVL